jgi:hypothetical protein
MSWAASPVMTKRAFLDWLAGISQKQHKSSEVHFLKNSGFLYHRIIIFVVWWNTKM